MGGTEAAAATGPEADCPAGDEAIETLEILVVFERDMMVHRDVPLPQPVGGASRDRHPTIVNTHQPAAACGMGCEPDFLHRIEAGGSFPVGQEDKLVGLSNGLARPCGRRRVCQV